MRPSLIACSRNALVRLPRGGLPPLWRWATLVPEEAEEARGAARERERAQCPLGGEKPKSRLAACC